MCANVRVCVGVLGGVGVYWLGCLADAVCVSKCMCVYLSILCAHVFCVCVCVFLLERVWRGDGGCENEGVQREVQACCCWKTDMKECRYVCESMCVNGGVSMVLCVWGEAGCVY